MLFNSLEFAVFFPLVTVLYFALPHRARGPWLLLASCVFYMAFIPKYILVLFATILIDYFAALRIETTSGRARKAWLIVSIISTCGVLFVFKYFNFFNDSAVALAHLLGLPYAVDALRLILPVGLSFHTFQSLSYVIEVYRGAQKAEHAFGKYALYVMFYPQLVAGPIERPQNLLHQFDEVHSFDYARIVSGLQLMAWGFIKKVVVADRLAEFVNRVYDAPQQFSGLPLVIATLAFAFQIYCDFSGYSDIAIGSAQVMGFRLMRNFRRPYFSPSIGEFWRRWHISLSTWFRDYLYLPLGGNRRSHLRNLFITFLVSGLWHGARWTFVIWGALHAFYLIAGILLARMRLRGGQLSAPPEQSSARRLLHTPSTFGLVSVAWIFFRANSLHDAWYVFTHLGVDISSQLAAILHGSASARAQYLFLGFEPSRLYLAIAAVGALLMIEFWQERLESAGETGSIRARIVALPIPARWLAYSAAVVVVTALGVFGSARFIYFQF